jgi:hypothetical protein
MSAPRCDNCEGFAHYEVVMTTVMGEASSFHHCAACSFHLGGWVFPNNDASFAGPENVVETITFRLLAAEQFRSMATDPQRRSWTAPCHPREFICLMVTGRDGDSLEVGVRYSDEPISWYQESLDHLDAVRARHRGEGLREIEMIPDNRDHVEFRQVWP